MFEIFIHSGCVYCYQSDFQRCTTLSKCLGSIIVKMLTQRACCNAWLCWHDEICFSGISLFFYVLQNIHCLGDVTHIQEHTKSAFLDVHRACGVHTVQEGWGFYCTLVQVRHLQLKEFLCEMSEWGKSRESCSELSLLQLYIGSYEFLLHDEFLHILQFKKGGIHKSESVIGKSASWFNLQRALIV